MEESNKKAFIGIAAALAIGGAATGIAYFATESQAYVAKVNGAAIHTDEYNRVLAQTRKQYASRFGIDFKTDQGKQVEKDMQKGLVGQFVERQLILSEATARHVQVEPKQVDAKLAEIKKGFPDEAAFEKALKDNDMKVENLRDRIKEGLTVEAVTAAVTKDIAVTDADVKKYYDENAQMFKKPEEVNAVHILVKDEKLAKEILSKLQKGADFAALASAHSEDPGSKTQGGSLGFFGRGRMVPEFEKAAFSLKKDALSGLVKTQFGYHILKGGEHRTARTQPFDEVKVEIKEKLAKERQQAAFGQWLQAEKAKAKIEYKAGFDPAAAPAGAAPGGIPGMAPQGQPAAAGHGAGDGHDHGAGDGHDHGAAAGDAHDAKPDSH